MQGLILLNKPEGITSYKAVAIIKRLSGEKRVGHTGTLDPMATGVLPILIGRSTTLSNYMLESDKQYYAEVKLGVTTDTCDITGEVLSEMQVLEKIDLESTLKSFLGRQKQIPPMYSALKRNGVPLYKLARQGVTVEIESRDIEISNLEIKKPLDSNGIFGFQSTVSKGTYIRSLARDIGEKIGCGATLSKLVRTSVAGFNIEDCVKIEDLEKYGIEKYLMPAETLVMHLREISVTKKQAIRFSNGGQLDFDRLNIENPQENELFRVKYNGILLGIGYAELSRNLLSIKSILLQEELI